MSLKVIVLIVVDTNMLTWHWLVGFNGCLILCVWLCVSVCVNDVVHTHVCTLNAINLNRCSINKRLNSPGTILLHLQWRQDQCKFVTILILNINLEIYLQFKFHVLILTLCIEIVAQLLYKFARTFVLNSKLYYCTYYLQHWIW